MTKREAAIVSAYTGCLIGEFHEMHKYIEEKLDRPVYTHEMAFASFQEELKDVVKPDFISIVIE